MSLNGKIAEQIQQLIAERRYGPGSQLPSERELAEIFGINRTTVGEAISQLESYGLVKKMVGRGTFVIDMPRSVLSETIERFYVFGTCSAAELLEFREMLEPIVARMAAENATEEHMRKLAEFVEMWEQTFQDERIDSNVEADVMFHEMLAQATRNSMIIAFYEGIQRIFTELLLSQRRAWLTSHRENGVRRDTINIHRKIYEAVVAHDPALAAEIMTQHMQVARTTLWSDILQSESSV